MSGDERHRGGCQCGAVRFEAHGAPMRVSICHCRMCQRASGNLIAPLAEFANEAVFWKKGEPALFASSNVAERGFCAACGAPLFLRDIGGETIEFMLGSLDAPERCRPSYHYGVESRISWLREIWDLPAHETDGGSDNNADAKPVESWQAPLEKE